MGRIQWLAERNRDKFVVDYHLALQRRSIAMEASKELQRYASSAFPYL